MENIGSNEVMDRDPQNIKSLEEEFYRLLNSYGIRPSYKIKKRIKKLIRLRKKILPSDPDQLYNVLFEKYKDNVLFKKYIDNRKRQLTPQGYLLQDFLIQVFLIEFIIEEEKRALPPQFPITPIDRTTAQNLLPVLMHRGIFSKYKDLPTYEEIIKKEKRKLNKQDGLTFEETREALTRRGEYKYKTYAVRDYGTYAIGFDSSLYIDHIEQTEDELKRIVLTPYLFKDMNKNIEEALKRIRLYKLAHKIAHIILAEGYAQNTWDGLAIPKKRILELLGYSPGDKQAYQDIKEALYSLRWVSYRFWDYEFTNRKKQRKKERAKAIGNFIYNLVEDSKNYKLWVNKVFVGCVEELLNKLPRSREEKKEIFNRGYFAFPTRVLPLTKDYSTPAYLLTQFFVREKGNKKLKKNGYKVIAYKVERYIKEAHLQYKERAKNYKYFIEALKQVEIIYKTDPTIKELEHLSPAKGIKNILYTWIPDSPKALDKSIENKLTSKKK